MGFFNKMKSMAEKANKLLNDDDDDDDDDGNGQKVATVPPPSDKSLFRMGALATPAPPPVPTDNSHLSVRIAVNGKEYGPYERATLREMISNGALTPDTLVFMEGMTEWAPAHSVTEVNELFGNKKPIPKAPPIPWANSSTSSTEIETSTKPSEEQPFNILSPKLNRLITAAVADGEISDLERQVLIRNAQEEGVAMDEFVMVLEARLYEQRRVLQAQEDAKNRAQKEIEMKAAATIAAAKASAPRQPQSMTKCPHCGAPVKALATVCPECGYDYPSETSSNISPWEKLSNQLAAIDNEKASGLMGKYMSVFGQEALSPDKINKKKNIIENFPIPSDKKGIFDFFVGCAPLSKSESMFSKNGLEGAYKKKAQQVLIKARVILKDDPKLLEEINAIAKQYKIKA